MYGLKKNTDQVTINRYYLKKKVADAVKFVLFTYNFLHFIQEITHGTQF